MINAIVRQGDITAVIELPKTRYQLAYELVITGMRLPSTSIKLFDDKGKTEVQVYSNDELGQHLCSLLTSDDTIATAAKAAYLLETADPSFKEEIAQKLLSDGYSSAAELMEDIQEQTYNAGPYKLVFFFPITGQIMGYEDEEPFEASDETIYNYSNEINDAIQSQQNRDWESIASFFNGDAALKAKLVAADWAVEELDEDTVLGKCTLHLRDQITAEEKESLRDWVWGQNSDGAFECLEDDPIEIGDSQLSISLWNDSDDYFVLDRTELDEYLQQQSQMNMGGM